MSTAKLYNAWLGMSDDHVPACGEAYLKWLAFSTMINKEEIKLQDYQRVIFLQVKNKPHINCKCLCIYYSNFLHRHEHVLRSIERSIFFIQICKKSFCYICVQRFTYSVYTLIFNILWNIYSQNSVLYNQHS
jgi:hypothetical protein